MALELKVDPERAGKYQTGIYIRAKDSSGKYDNADVAELDRESLIKWLRSRPENPDWILNLVLILLDYPTTDR